METKTWFLSFFSPSPQILWVVGSLAVTLEISDAGESTAQNWSFAGRHGLNMLMCAIHVMIKYEYGEVSSPSYVRAFALKGAIANK